MNLGHLFPWPEESHIKDIWEEYSLFHAGPKHGMAPYEILKERSGVRWPFYNGKETRWRYNREYDPAAKTAEFDFYGKDNHKASLWIRPYEKPPEEPDQKFPFWLSHVL